MAGRQNHALLEEESIAMFARSVSRPDALAFLKMKNAEGCFATTHRVFVAPTDSVENLHRLLPFTASSISKSF